MTEVPSPPPSTSAAVLDAAVDNQETPDDVLNQAPVSGAAPPASPEDPSEGLTPASSELNAMKEDPELKDVKSTLLDSAELSNRAASQALKAGADLQEATHNLIHAHATQRKHGLIVLAMFGALTLIAMVLFVFMSARLQQRIAQADAMLLAVGKRVVAMNEAIELIGGTGEALRDISSKQNSITSQQAKLDSRLDELMRSTQNVMQSISQTSDPKNQDNLKKLLQAMDERVQSNSNALRQLSSQLRSAPAASPQPAMIRREVEATLQRLQSKTPPPVSALPAPVITSPPPPNAWSSTRGSKVRCQVRLEIDEI